jgi:uncharacterized protein YdaU (DUF1376 family)
VSLPYYKRFPRDFLDGSIGMSLEVKGAYAIVLDLIYMRDGRLPDDARFIAGQLGCSVRKWSAIREELIARGKLKVESGIISNFRADYLLEETRKYRDKMAENAATPRKNKDLAEPKPSHTDTDTEEDSSVDKSTDAVRVVVDHDRDAWTKAVTLLTGQGGMKAEKARPFFGRLLRDHGLEPRDLLPALVKATVSGTQDPASYLTRSAQGLSKRRAEPVKPKRVGWV